MELQKGNSSVLKQRIQMLLYTELTHTGNIPTHTEPSLYSHVQLNSIAEAPKYPIRL